MSARKTRLTWIAGLMIVLSVVTAIYSGYRIHQADRFNVLLKSNALDEAATYPGPYGQFAEALHLQRQKRFQDALKLYAKLRKEPDPVGAAARYNTGTLYLQWAMTTTDEDSARLTVPLLELSKVTYRQLLRDHHNHWPARYNLERVLHLQPDPDDLKPSAQGMPERSPRALGVIESARELP
ncbi:MAG: hypothetical protein OES09_00385 [Gammaproteobacteria bacterium]|nr:hypothetical protein [Gammaproteobacteria bacterium]